MRTETVKIKHPGFPDGVTINKVDFNAEIHEAHGTPKTIVAPPPTPPGEVDSEADTDGVKLKVADMRELLTQRGIVIPDGAKKADLQALINASN